MWIQVFKSGEHTDSSGKSAVFSNEKLDEITGKYNTKVMESSSNEEPWGWIERLKRRGDVLMAKVKELSPQIIDEVKRGLFKKVSIALYPDMMLRHVGLLGAATPAVKGLKNVTFAESSDYFEYEENYNNQELGCESIIISNLRKENEVLQNKLNDLQKEVRKNEFSEFVNSLMDTEKGAVLTPHQAEVLTEILELSYSDSENEFEEADSLFTKIKQFFSEMKPNFNFRKEYNFQTHLNQENEFESNKNVDPIKLNIHKKALQFIRENPELTYEDALLRLQ